MKQLTLTIQAPDDALVQEALDDVMAAIAAGQERADLDEGNVRIAYAWQDVPEQS